MCCSASPPHEGCFTLIPTRNLAQNKLPNLPVALVGPGALDLFAARAGLHLAVPHGGDGFAVGRFFQREAAVVHVTRRLADLAIPVHAAAYAVGQFGVLFKLQSCRLGLGWSLRGLG